MPPLPVTAAQALLTSLGNQARSFYSPTGNPFIDPGGFIASEDPAPIFQRPAKQLARAVCRQWARQPGPSTNPAADRLYAGACGEYLDSIGEGVDPGQIGPPFPGGQCPEVYLVTYTATQDGFTTEPATVAALGPITGIRGRITETGARIVELGCRGVNLGSPTCISVPNTGAGFYLLSGLGSSGSQPTATITGISPCGADNCGDPPPEYERPRPPIVLPPITPIFIDLPDIGEINVNVDVNVDGSIEIGSPELNVDVTINPPGDETDGTGDTGNNGDIVPDGGVADSPADTGNGGTASSCAPDGFELVGVRVEVLEAPIGANEYANNPAQVFRGIGYVRMGYPGRLAVDVGGAAVISPQFFLAPVRGLTCWEVRANNGFIHRVTPYYREKQQ